MSVVNKFIEWIRFHFPKEKVNPFSIFVILIYYYVGLLSYITFPLTSFHSFFTTSNISFTFIRASLTAIIVLYCAVVLIVNNKTVEWKWLVVFVYILLFTLLSTAISPAIYSYIYVADLYNIVHKVTVSSGFSRTAIMFLSSISDFALGFCFLFILPLVIKDRKQALILLMPIVFIGVAECVYSVFAEKEEYLLLIQEMSNPYGGYQVSIGASFGNKQDWGSFATTSFASALFSFVVLEHKRGFYSFLRVFLITSASIIFLFTILSLCKTAILACFFIIIFFIFYLLIKMKKENKVVFYFFISFLLLIFLSIIALYFINMNFSIPFVSAFFSFVEKYLLSHFNIETILGRTRLWYAAVDKLPTYDLFFGLSKAGVISFSKYALIDGQNTLHNGFIYFLLSYGIMGFSIYIIILAMVIKNAINIFKYNEGVSLCVFGVIVAAFVFSLAESEVFIISGSNPIFVFNVIGCSFAKGYLDDKEKLYV